VVGAMLAICVLPSPCIAHSAGGKAEKQRRHRRSVGVDFRILAHHHHIRVSPRWASHARSRAIASNSVARASLQPSLPALSRAVGLSDKSAPRRAESTEPETESPPPPEPEVETAEPVPTPEEGSLPPAEESAPTPPPPEEEPSPAPPEEEAPAPPEEEPSPPPVEEEASPPPPEEPAEEVEEEASSPSVPEAPVPPSPTVYWGATIGDHVTGVQAPWDMTAVTEFEGMTGKKLSLLNFFSPFANCSSSPCSFYDFPAGVMDDVRAHGTIPVLSWASQSIPSNRTEPDFELSDVIAGTYDSYIREFAEDARDWGHPFFLRFNWEMNGRWFPWSEGVNGNQPGEFVAAWRHVHDIFSAAGATNATWVWCPNIDPDDIFLGLASQYPGDTYVDWTGLDGYNWGTNPAKPDRWRSFDELYGSTYGAIAGFLAPGKPLMIGEVASTEYGGSKASWISDMLARIPTAYPTIRGLVWFDKYDDGMDWPIETSTSATSAFASGIQDAAFGANAFGALSASPIPPPG
jgi:hypothetical protein